jgi:SAM-dependent methyltransferase
MRNSPLVCPRCHAQLSWSSSQVRCVGCGGSYPIEGEIVDFAPGEHYDRFVPSDVLSQEHLRGLELEVEGSRRRIEDFYLPMIAPRPALRILDCGCGNGVSVATLLAHGFDAWGNDLSELRAWQWRRLPIGDRLVVANALRLPFPDAYFDAVISSGVIEHIGVEESTLPRYSVRPLPDRDERRLAFLRELGRVVAPGGEIFIDCPNGAFPVDFWHSDAAGRPRFHSVREKFLPTFGELRRAAREALPGSAVEALSPDKRLQFRQAGRHLHGRLLGPFAGALFRAMKHRPFRWLAATAVNPFLVVRIATPHPKPRAE